MPSIFCLHLEKAFHRSDCPKRSGLPVSLSQLLEHGPVEGDSCHHDLELAVFGLEFLRSLGIVDFHTAVLIYASAPGGLGGAKAPRYLCHRFVLVQDSITLSKLCSDLIWCVLLALHVIPSRIYFRRSSHILGGPPRVHDSNTHVSNRSRVGGN